MNLSYREFLERKVPRAEATGFEPLSPPSDALFEHQKDIAAWMVRGGRRACFAAFGLGKCHGAGTLILMADGSSKAVETITEGEQLMGDDGTPRNVLSLARGRERLYRITLKNGDSFTCNESHAFALTVSNRYAGLKKSDKTTLTVKEWLALPSFAKRNCFKHYKVPLEFSASDVPFDPYLYGTWLGDGSSRSLEWTINDRDVEIVEQIQKFASSRGLHCHIRPERGCSRYSVTKGRIGKSKQDDAFYFIQSSVVNGEKRINRAYLHNSRSVRLALLAGLIDTDGSLIDNCYEIATKWEGLRDDILFLCRSLGFRVKRIPKIVNGVAYHRIFISGDTHLIPCLTRKKASIRKQIKNPLLFGFTVEEIGEGEYYGFEIDGNHLYLLADFTVTHNTRIHLQVAKWILEKQPTKKYLIVAPLGVRQEFTKVEGPALGMDIRYCKTDEEVQACESPFVITNYERVRDGNITISGETFAGAGLDESSVLRSFGSKTYQTFLDLFKAVPYRFVFTATPSPNRHKELIHYAGFLGVMDTGDALTRFFKRDSAKAGNLTLLESMEERFWEWVSSWAVFLQSPADLGYDATGYDLPEMHVHWHRIPVDHKKAWNQFDSWGQAQLLADQSSGLKELAEVKRDTIINRIQFAQQLIGDNPDKHWLLWHDLEAERHLIERMIPEAKTAYGSQELEDREELILGFARGEYPILATKPSIAGSGCNFQRHCSDAIFLGSTYKFNDFIQSVHRIARFQQKNEVNIHIIFSEAEETVIKTLQEKWKNHNELVARMVALLKKFKLSLKPDMQLVREMGCDRAEVTSEKFRAIRNDTILEVGQWPENCVDEIVTSIPFGNQYEYSPSYHDLGHNQDNDAFFEQLDYLIPNLLRVLKPGRVAAIHVKDRIRFGNVTGLGMPTVDRFSDKTADAFVKHGFAFMARITIDTDVVRENNQTYRLGWTEMTKDGTKMGAGLPEYVLVFRKLPSDLSNAYADVPVTKDKSRYSRARWQIDAAGFWRSSGNKLPDPETLLAMPLDEIGRLWRSRCAAVPYDYAEHVDVGIELERRGKLPASFMLFPPVSKHPDVWTDIQRMRVLNSEQSRRSEDHHVCPLQLDIAERLITRYSNPGEIVFDPFAGIFTVPYVAIHNGRIGWGCELSAEYWRCGVGYCEQAQAEITMPTLFDLNTLDAQRPAAQELEALKCG